MDYPSNEKGEARFERKKLHNNVNCSRLPLCGIALPTIQNMQCTKFYFKTGGCDA
jgi:hypothetical protein